MYTFVEPIRYADGSIKEYVCKDAKTGRRGVFKSAEIKRLMVKGVKFLGLELKNGRLFISTNAFVEPPKRLTKPEKHERTVLRPAVNTVNANNAFTFMSGKRLESFIHEFVRRVPNERDIVSEVEFAVRNVSFDNIVAVSGLRRTGKTFCLRHTVNRLIESGVSSDDIVFISINGDVDVGELIQLCAGVSQQYVFIDEITFATNFLSRAMWFADTLAGSLMKKVVLSGTHSYVWSQAERASLYGRTWRVNIGSPSLPEYSRLFPERIQGLSSASMTRHYYQFSGVLDKDEYNGIRSAYRGFQEAILGNILTTIRKNQGYRSFTEGISSLCTLSVPKQAVLLMRILTQAAMTLSASANKLLLGKADALSIAMLKEAVAQAESERDWADVSKAFEGVNKTHYMALRRALLELDVVGVVPNVVRESEYAKKVFDSEIVCKVPSLLYSLMQTKAVGGAYGALLENIVLYRCIEELPSFLGSENDPSSPRITVGYCRFELSKDGKRQFPGNKDTPEVDIVVQKLIPAIDNGNETQTLLSVLIEVKQDDQMKSDYAKTLRSDLIELVIGNVVDRFVVYMGNSGVDNLGIRYINAYDFLMNIKKYFSCLGVR